MKVGSDIYIYMESKQSFKKERYLMRQDNTIYTFFIKLSFSSVSSLVTVFAPSESASPFTPKYIFFIILARTNDRSIIPISIGKNESKMSFKMASPEELHSNYLPSNIDGYISVILRHKLYYQERRK